MPSVLLASILVIGVVCAVIDCEVECVDICAGGALLTMVKCICSRCSIGCAVPCVLVTSCHIVSSVVMLIDVEEESICTGAAIDVSIVVNVGAALIVYDIMPICAGGALLTMVKCICSGCSIGCAVPCVLVTSCHIVSGVVMLTDVEVKCICAWAIVVIAIAVCVSSTQVVVYIVPSVLLTGILVIGIVRSVVNCQVEGIGIGAR